MSAQKKRDDELTIERPDRFLARERTFQRAGIVGLIVFAVAGVAGMFGDGPLADATVTGGGATIHFQRFARLTYRTELEISVEGVSTPTVDITMSRAFLDRVERLELRPGNALARMDGDTAIFQVPAHNGVASLLLHYEPKTYGVLEADVRVGAGPAAQVRQIVFF